jgi:F-type H+-transporting ATPase subunit b
MPQLDVSTFIPQLFWLAVTFIVLFILMKAVALPRVGAAIGARQKRLDDDLAAASEMKTQAEAAIAAYERALAGARAQAQMTIKETSDRLAAEAAERQRQLASSLAEQTAAAERQIAEAKARAVGDIRSVAGDVAASVVARLSGAPVDPGRVAAAVDRALAERSA